MDLIFVPNLIFCSKIQFLTCYPKNFLSAIFLKKIQILCKFYPWKMQFFRFHFGEIRTFLNQKGRKLVKPPPFLKHRYGKRQTFAKSTAKPTTDSRKSTFRVQVSRLSSRVQCLSNVCLSSNFSTFTITFFFSFSASPFAPNRITSSVNSVSVNYFNHPAKIQTRF